MTQHLASALHNLQRVLQTPPRLPQSWRFLVGRRLAAVDSALAHEHVSTSEPWLTPRESALDRERRQLRARALALQGAVAQSAEPQALCGLLVRLAQDLEHHQQKVHDLAYEAVGWDVGGSE